MKKIFTCFLFVCLGAGVFAQQLRTLTGQLMHWGEPMIGASIIIKGTRIGTVSDVEGKYHIKVAPGDVLEIRYTGIPTQEIIVTEEMLRQADDAKAPGIHTPMPPFVLASKNIPKPVPGTIVLNDTTAQYRADGSVADFSIHKIKFSRKKETYKIAIDQHGEGRPWGGSYTAGFGMEKPNLLPALQSEYAAGRPADGDLHWRGPSEGEVFSWGPLLATLEYAGNGKGLAPLGSGNGRPADAFKPASFLRTGLQADHTLSYCFEGRKQAWWLIDAQYHTRSGIVPHSNHSRYGLFAKMQDFQVHGWTLNTDAFFHDFQGRLLQRGGNLSSIFAATWRTPIDFDNAAGLRSRDAARQTEAFRFPDGRMRSAAPGWIDNPYGLAYESPDKERLQRFGSSLFLHKLNGKFPTKGRISFDQQHNTIRFGLPPAYSGAAAGRLTERIERESQVRTSLDEIRLYRSSRAYNEHKLFAGGFLQYMRRTLERADGRGFLFATYGDNKNADALSSLNRSLTRASFEGFLKGVFERDKIAITYADRFYFSNTLRWKDHINLYPSIELRYKEGYHWNDWYWDIRLSAARFLSEAPLTKGNWPHVYTALPAEQYNQAYESSELFFYSGLKPETSAKAALDIAVKYYNEFDVTANIQFFRHTVNQFIAPIRIDNRFEMQNIGDTRNQGLNVSLIMAGYRYTSSSRLEWESRIVWSASRYKLTRLRVDVPWVPIAGFQEAHTALAPGEPVGAIYGTRFQRNVNGEILIDDQGFPLADTRMQRIGNPQPDWIAKLFNQFRYGPWDIQVSFEYRKGGDIWNGTRAALDYWGRSEQSGIDRKKGALVFPGVRASDGAPNTTLIDPTGASQAFADHYRVRYGLTGIGESYVEDGSWFRLNDCTLTYTIKRYNVDWFREIGLGLSVQNILLFTPASGIDPAVPFWGYAEGNGMNLFNLPSTRSLHAQIRAKF